MKNRNGKRIPVTVEVPDGECVGTFLVLHGLGGWKDQSVVRTTSEVVQEFRYIAVSFDAADGPMAPDRDTRLSTTSKYIEDVEDVIAWTTAQDWFRGPLSIAGHSLGAMAAVQYTAKHPADISKLILLGPAVSWKLYTPMFTPFALWWLIVGTNNTPGPHRSTIPLGRGWLLDFLKFDIRTLARTLPQQTLVVIGAKDGMVGTTAAIRKFAGLFPNGSFATVPEAGHTFYKHEAPLAATMRTWLTSS